MNSERVSGELTFVDDTRTGTEVLPPGGPFPIGRVFKTRYTAERLNGDRPLHLLTFDLDRGVGLGQDVGEIRFTRDITPKIELLRNGVGTTYMNATFGAGVLAANEMLEDLAIYEADHELTVLRHYPGYNQQLVEALE